MTTTMMLTAMTMMVDVVSRTTVRVDVVSRTTLMLDVVSRTTMRTMTRRLQC